MLLKICGIYRDEDALYINRYRPDYFGMVIDFPKSHRSVSPEKAARLRALVDGDIPAVGVFVNKDAEEIAELLNSGVIDIAQLHGDESVEDIIRIREKCGKPVWKAFRVSCADDVAAAKTSPADLVLFDKGCGTGETFDWDIIRDFDRPFALAGGINVSNIREAEEKLRPYLIDISSGVETDKKKDEAKIKEAADIVRGLK